MTLAEQLDFHSSRLCDVALAKREDAVVEQAVRAVMRRIAEDLAEVAAGDTVIRRAFESAYQRTKERAPHV